MIFVNMDFIQFYKPLLKTGFNNRMRNSNSVILRIYQSSNDILHNLNLIWSSDITHLLQQGFLKPGVSETGYDNFTMESLC